MRRALSLSAALLALAAIAAPRAFATCATNVTANPGTLQTFINGVTGVGPGDYCINLNPGLYNEKITIPASIVFVDQASRLILQPASTGVEISSSNAALPLIEIDADSVTLSNIQVAANAATPIGVLAAGNWVTLSNVVVIDTMAYFSNAGIEVVGHYGSVVNSSAAAQGVTAYGLFLTSTSSGSAVLQSTATSAGSSAALEVEASSVTVNQSYGIGVGGPGLGIQGSPNTLFILNSTFTSTGGYGGFLNTAAGVVLVDDYFQSAGADGLHITNSASNSISYSTMASAGAGFSALYLNAAGNSVTASNLYFTGTSGAALDVDGSGSGNDNTFTNLVVQSNRDGVQFNGGATNNTIAASTVTAYGANGRALAVINGNSEIITTSVLWNTGANNAVELISAGGSGTSITRSSITTNAGGSFNALYSAQANLTVADSFISSNFGAAVMIDGVSGNWVNKSTMTCDTNVAGALYLTNSANNNTITLSSMYNPRGDAVRIENSANNNSISQSTMASAGSVGGYALNILNSANNNTIYGSALVGNNASYPAVDINVAASNVIDRSKITNGLGPALYLSGGANHNTVSSTIVTASTTPLGGFGGAVLVWSASSNTFVNDTVANTLASNGLYVASSASMTIVGGSYTIFNGGNGNGAIVFDNTHNSGIKNASITTALGQALYLFASSSNSLLGLNVQGGSFTNAALLSSAVSNTVSISSFANTGTGVGLRIIGGGGNTVSGSTMTSIVSAGLHVDNSNTNSVSASVVKSSSGTALTLNNSNTNTLTGTSIVTTSTGAFAAFEDLNGSANSLNASSVQALTSTQAAVQYLSGTTNGQVLNSTITAAAGAGIYADSSSNLTFSNTAVQGSTGVWLNNVFGNAGNGFYSDTITGLAAGHAALMVTNAPANSTTTVSGSTLTATSPATMALSVNGSGSAVLSLLNEVDVHGSASVFSGGLLSASNHTVLGGDLLLGLNAFVGVTSPSTFAFWGLHEAPIVTAQTLTNNASRWPMFGAFDLQVASFSARGNSFQTTTFSDVLAGSTAAFTASTSPAYWLSNLTLRGAPGSLVTFRSLTPGTTMNLAVAVATVTLAQITDSDASQGATIHANDGTSVDGGDNANWNFNPLLDVELPGETFVEGVGKTGAPTTQTAGPVAVTVRAISASNATIFASSITVNLGGSQLFDDFQTQPLQNGTTVFHLVLRKAEPAPVSHTLTATSTQTYNGGSAYTDVVGVNPGALAKLQLLLNGEAPDPGSSSGKTAAALPVVATLPASAQVRGVDAYWNVTPSASGIVMLSTSGANLPQSQSLLSGSTSFSSVVFASSATGRDLVAMDLTNGAITASTSTPFTVFAPTSSSPTVSIDIANNSVQTSLGGAISGTASDPSGVTQVQVQLGKISNGLFYDWVSFFGPTPVSSGAALGTPGGLSTTWTVGVPDTALTPGSSYYVTVRSNNASGNAITTISTFTYNPAFGQVGSPGDGEGTAAVTFEDTGGNPTSVGCGVVAASMTFVTGPHGINAGGQIAIHLPDNWSAMTSAGPYTPASNPEPFAGSLVVGSTTSFSVNLSPTSQSSATFGNNWFLYNAQGGLTPGQAVYFTMTSFVGGGPTSVGPQNFTVLTQGDPTNGLFRPIASQPGAALKPGKPTTLQFSNQQPLTLGPLQTSSTMQLNVFDACGNSTNTATNTTAFINALNNTGADPGALFFLANNGGPVPQGQLTIPGNASASPAFYFETSTPGPYYEQLTSSAVFFGGAFTWATRYVQVLGSTVGLSGVSIDTGTVMPGVSVATMTPGSFSGAAVVNFTLSNANVPWEMIISPDSTTYQPELVHRNGFGQPGRTLSWTGLTETSYPNTLVKPGGPYYVKVRVGGGVVEDDSLRVYVATTASVFGTVNSTGAYAYVNAQGPNTNFANFAVADATGHFEIYGLQNGGRYNIVATTGSVTSGQFVQLQSSSFNVTASNLGTDVGAMPFPTPTFLRMRVQIPQPAPFEFWGGFNAFSTTGQQAWGTLHYLQGADKSDSGGQSFGGSASTWTMVGVTPGTYNLQINLPSVSISSSLPNVVIPPGTTTDIFLALQRKANVYGWAVVPSSTQYGTWVSVQGTKAGDARPTVFGGTYLQGWQYGVGQTSGVYSLFGLDPGSWTVTARGQGFASASTSVYISSSADLGDPVDGGVDLTLSSGTTLNGVLQILGDSSNLPNTSNGGLNVFINAYNPQTYSNGFAQVFIATDPAQARSTFSITGLDPGTYFLNTWVQGTQAPQLSTTVVSTNSFTTMNLVVDSARAAISVLLPGPAPDFHKVGIYYSASSTQPAQIQDFGALPGLRVWAASATWVSPSFSPGFFTVTGQYSGRGTFDQASGQLADGQTTPITLDLRGSTRTVSGTVVIGGNVNLNINGTAVSVSSVPGVLAQATTNEYCLSGFTDSITTPTFHLELLPISRQGNYLTQPLSNPSVRNLGPGGGGCAHPQSFFGGNNGDVDPFLAYVVNISTDGSFTIPGVPPGGYVLRVPTNLDSIYGFGPDELPPVKQFVRVTTSDVSGLTFTISQGVSVSGLVRMPTGLIGSRGMQVSLNDSLGSAVRTFFVNFNQSNTAPYFLDRVPDGTYALVVRDFSYPQAFGSAPITLKVSGASISQDIQLQQTGIIKGKLAVQQFLGSSTTAQFTLIDAHNANQLPSSFHIYAEANPWLQGGHRDADSACGGPSPAGAAASPAGGGCGGGQPAFDDNGQFSISGVLPGLYDIHFESQNDPNDSSAMKLARSFAPGISVNGGGTTDIGTFNLTSAITLRGTVSDATTGLPIANMPMRAQAALSQNREVDTPQATTDSSGTYQLVGLDPSVKVYDVYAGKRDDNGAAPPPYELKVAPSVDVTSVSVVNFAMTPAPYSVSGQILGAAGGPGLQIPFGNNGGGPQVGAEVFLNKSGVQPHDNPIADVMVPTDPQGRFSIPSLTTGTYKLTAVSLGYASFSRNVAITSAPVSLSPITLGLGATLTGALRKPDGSNPSQREVDTLVAVTNNFSQLLIGQLTPDANANTYTNYTISGFQPGLSYRVMIFGKGGNSAAITPPEGSNIVFSTTTESRTLDLVMRPAAPYVFSKARRSGTAFALRFELSQPLRSRQASDNDLTAVLSTFSAAGTLSGWDLDSSRSILTALYTPGVSESSFTVRLHGYSTQTDPDSLDPVNPQFVYDSTYTFFIGIDGYYANVMSNMNGGTLAIDDDPGRVAIGGGSFQIDASSSVKIGLAIAQEALTSAPGLQATGLAPVAANIKAMRYGGSAYPSDVFRAMAATPPGVSPFSAFYNVLLPLGIRTSLQKPVPLTINYSTSTDPTTLNLYWYNAAANAYVLQQDVTGAKPVIDTVNHTITINVNHFSTFVLFNAGVAVISGNAFGGEFTAYNFPNPFDLSVKTVTAIHGAGAQTVRGTMVSIGLPPDISGEGSLKIYNVAGEKVRTIDLGSLDGGKYYYQPWDGRNDSGRDVASGVYIGQIKVGDHSKFFKMALIK